MIELVVEPKEFQLSEIAEFAVGMKITNPSDRWIDVDISKSVLWVNSERSIAWDLAVQNGTLVNLKIAPHKSETISWQMGDAFFENAGTYELKLVWGTFSAKEQVFVLSS